MAVSRFLGMLTALTVALPASAHPRHRHHQPVPIILPAPAIDAVDLSTLAPPAPLSTDLVTYGDATFARARAQARYPREEKIDAEEATTIGVPYPCAPRAAGSDSYSCRNDPSHPRSYRQGYAFTPSYVSAPQVVQEDRAQQASVFPPVTGLFWAVNSVRLDPH